MACGISRIKSGLICMILLLWLMPEYAEALSWTPMSFHKAAIKKILPGSKALFPKKPSPSRATENYLNSHPGLKRNLQIETSPPENGYDSSWTFYDNWSEDRKDRLERFYQLMLRGEPLPLPERVRLAPRFVNGEELFRPSVVAYATNEQAIDVYLAQIAHALYLDMRGLVPWRLEDFSGEELSYLFMSSNYFRAFTASDGTMYYIVDRVSFQRTTENILNDPRDIYEFLDEEGLLAEDQERTAMNLSVWFQQNLFHWGNAPKDAFFQTYPFLNDRIHPQPTPDQGNVVVAIEGCWSASRLYVDLMRVMNIPVKMTHNRLMGHDGREGHHAGLAFHWRDGDRARYLIHSDYLYTQTPFYDPMPANGDTGEALWNYLWLSPNDFSEFFDYERDQADVFAVQSWEQWEAFYRYASIALPSYFGITVYGGLTEAEIIDILVFDQGIEEQMASEAARNFIQAINHHGDGLDEALDVIEELHLLWRNETGK